THGASAQGKFHKRLSLTDLTFIGLGPTKAVWSWLPQRRPKISAPGAASSATFDAGTERVAWDRPRRSGDDAQAIAARDAPSKRNVGARSRAKKLYR
ncbi:hypothetical protein, partial [Xanthomonas campestris]|uniref:hypothetical protein n=1 Tax=Xanthomonas campestris TaxID=339 RepID=UPI0032E37FA7